MSEYGDRIRRLNAQLREIRRDLRRSQRVRPVPLRLRIVLDGKEIRRAVQRGENGPS